MNLRHWPMPIVHKHYRISILLHASKEKCKKLSTYTGKPPKNFVINLRFQGKKQFYELFLA